MNPAYNKNIIYAYTLVRIALGINIFLHGAVRIPKLEQFSTWMLGLYKDSFLPASSVLGMAYMIPLAEAAIGLFILLGLFSEKTYLAGLCLMITLIFGSCLIEKWEWAGIQMIYVLFYFILTHLVTYNQISLDSLRKGNQS